MDESKEACPACAISGKGITDNKSFFMAYEGYLSTLSSVNPKLKEQFITKILQFGEHIRSRCPEFSFAKLANVHLLPPDQVLHLPSCEEWIVINFSNDAGMKSVAEKAYLTLMDFLEDQLVTHRDFHISREENMVRHGHLTHLEFRLFPSRYGEPLPEPRPVSQNVEECAFVYNIFNPVEDASSWADDREAEKERDRREKEKEELERRVKIAGLFTRVGFPNK